MAEKKQETVIVKSKGRFIEMPVEEAAKFIHDQAAKIARMKGPKPDVPVLIKSDSPEFKKAQVSARGEDYDVNTGALKK